MYKDELFINILVLKGNGYLWRRFILELASSNRHRLSGCEIVGIIYILTLVSHMTGASLEYNPCFLVLKIGDILYDTGSNVI